MLQVTPTTTPGGTPSIAPIASSTPEYILAVNTLTGALENGESGFDGVISAPEELTLTGSSTDGTSYSGTGTIRVQRIRGTQYVRIVSPAVQYGSTVVYFETRNRIQNVSFKLTEDPAGKPFHFQLCSNRFERGRERCTKFYKVTVGTVTGQPVSLSKLGNKVFVESADSSTTLITQLSLTDPKCTEGVVAYVDISNTNSLVQCASPNQRIPNISTVS